RRQGGRVDPAREFAGRGETAVAAADVEGVGRARAAAAVDAADAGDVVAAQTVLDPGISGVHRGRGPGAGVAQAEGVADLVQGDCVQVVGRADVERLAGVEVDVAGDRVVVDRRRHEGLGQGAVAELVAADANVGHRRVALLEGARAGRGAAVGDDGDVEVGL